MTGKILGRKNKKDGFTLVEMLVSVAIFLSVMIIAVGSLISIINANRKSQGIKSVVDNVTFAIESISRDTRNGTNYKCLGSNADADFNCSSGGPEVSYLPSGGANLVHYRFKSLGLAFGEGNIQKCIETGAASGCDSNSSNWQSMTAPTVNITNMVFYVLGLGKPGGVGQTDGRQPRVIITAQGVITDKDGTQTSFNLQTTASERARL
jgi:prepilin-type N-terminal cleavage/methylation domain-containing protein